MMGSPTLCLEKMLRSEKKSVGVPPAFFGLALLSRLVVDRARPGNDFFTGVLS